MKTARRGPKSRKGPVFVIGLNAFVPHPGLRGLYMRTHLCVIAVRCERCKAVVGEPCRGLDGGWISDTHISRRRAFSDAIKKEQGTKR